MRITALVIGAVETALLVVAVVVSWGTPGLWPILLFLTATVVVGIVLAVRVGRNPIGWLMLAAAGLFLVQLPVGKVGEEMLAYQPDVGAWLLWFGGDREDTWVWFPPLWLLFTQVLLFFPNGRLPSRSWRPFWWFTICVGIYGVVVLSSLQTEVAPDLPSPAGWIRGDNPFVGLGLLGFLIAVLGSAWSLLRRYRTADVVTREQITWVVFAVVIVIGTYAVVLASVILRRDADWTLAAVIYTLIPVSIGVAVTKYRLYAIDRIVSRTVSYALVSVVVVAAYAVVVTSVSRLLPNSGALPVAGATLAAAGIFWPALRRVRTWVDRRFDRERYDAVQQVEAFAARMSGVTDPDAVAVDLLSTVERTLAPGTSGAWLRGSGV